MLHIPTRKTDILRPVSPLGIASDGRTAGSCRHETKSIYAYLSLALNYQGDLSLLLFEIYSSLTSGLNNKKMFVHPYNLESTLCT